MSKEKTVLPERRYYRLADAAHLLDCSADDLLHFAANGSLEILAAVNGLWVLGVRFDYVTYENCYTIAGKFLNPGFVVLRCESLRGLELFGRAEVRSVDACYATLSQHFGGPFNASGVFELFDELGPALEQSLHYWRLCSKECYQAIIENPESEPDAVNITKSDLWLRADELERMCLGGKNSISEMDNANKSNYLSLLNQASARFWANADRDDSTTHPKNQDVALWLEQRGLSSTLAGKAASIIRPEWAPVGRKPDK